MKDKVWLARRPSSQSPPLARCSRVCFGSRREELELSESRLLEPSERKCASALIHFALEPEGDIRAISFGLFDHLVGAREHGGWNVEAERLGGLEVYYKFVPGRRCTGNRRASRP